MRRNYLLLLALLFVFVFAAADNARAAYYDEHTGDSWEDAYIIDSAEDLRDLYGNVLHGDEPAGKYYKLGADIDLSFPDGRGDWYGIGDIHSFAGHFDGQGHTITINEDKTAAVPYYQYGLFHTIDTDGVAIKNLHVKGSIKLGYHAGGIVYELYGGTIESCDFEGDIIRLDGYYASFGGIVNKVFSGDVINCAFNGTVSDMIEAGGIVDYINAGNIINCKFSGTITIDNVGDNKSVGGIARLIEASWLRRDDVTFKNCKVVSGSKIIGNNGYGCVAGGIVGVVQSGAIKVTGCDTTGVTITAGMYIGGIIGTMGDDISRTNVNGNKWPSAYSEIGHIYSDTPTPTPTDPTLDSDGDGLPDVWETMSMDLDGDGSIDIDLPAMGADPNVPDLFIEVDYMYKPGSSATVWGRPKTIAGVSLRPSDAAMKIVMEQFARKRPAFPNGINLHIDTGPDSIMDLKTGKKWGSLSRSNTIDYADNFELGENGENWAQLAENNFDKARWNVFRHCIVLNKYNSTRSTGRAWNTPGQLFIVADVDDYVLKDDRRTAGTFMHELGHTLGLRHGGDDGSNYKPNYLSIMNYLYQTSGLISSPEYKTNYSEYVLPEINERSVNEERGIDPNSVTGGKITGAKWKLAVLNFISWLSDKESSGSIAGAWIDFNQNSKHDTNAAIDFYIENLDENGKEIPNVNSDVIPVSINDWEHLIFKAEMIGSIDVVVKSAASVKTAADKLSLNLMDTNEELTIDEAEELGLLHNPGDCEVSSVMPDMLYTGVNNQRVKLTVRNMFDTETTAHLQVTSDLFASVYSSDIEFAASADKIIELTVPSSALTAGKHALTYTLTCANEEVKTGTTEIEVQAVKPIVLKVGESETLTGTAVGAYALSVEDTAIATIEGSTVYAIEAGKTFIILKDLESDRTVCSLPIYVTETGELKPEDVADDTGTTDPTDPGDTTDPTDPTDTTDPDGTTDQTTSSNGSSGGCNSGLGLAALSVIALAVFKRR